jgi:hypothetical protein
MHRHGIVTQPLTTVAAMSNPAQQHLQQQQPSSPPPPSASPTHTHTSPPPSSSSSSSSTSPTEGLHLHLLPDAALATIAECLKPQDLIKGLQVVNHWALRVFAEEIKEVVLTTTSSDRKGGGLLKEDPPPESPLAKMDEAFNEAKSVREMEEVLRELEEATEVYLAWVAKRSGPLLVPLTFSSPHFPEGRRVRFTSCVSPARGLHSKSIPLCA